ncbi:MAG: PDZ domain-containing protein [Flavobacteriales bacterium]|nr:PDZ domain-containing protein [Flavobacteriales bacterium]
MKKLNILFQLSTLTSLLVAGLFTFAVAQSADETAKDQKLTIDIEVTENGKTKKITKELDAVEGDDIKAILKDLDVLDDIDIRGTGERIEIKVRKEVDGDDERDLRVHIMGDDDELRWFSGGTNMEKRPLLGVYISTYDKDGQKGALVDGLIEGSAAEKAELKEGDVIISVNNTDVTSEKQLRDVIDDFKVGEEVNVKYLRDGKKLSKKVTLGESKDMMVFKHGFGPEGSNEFFFEGEFDEEALQEQMEKLKDMNINFDFDMDFDDNSAFLGVTPGEKTDAGVSLGKVIEGSSAEKMGLKSGDVITKLDGKSVEHFDDLAEVIKAKEAGDKIEVEYLRDGKKGKLNGELGKRDGRVFQKRIMSVAPDCKIGGAGPWAPEVVKEVKVVIELKDATKEDEEMLAEPADVDFSKSLALNKIEFAPNPSDGQFNLAFDLPKKQNTRVMVFNQTGQKVYEELLNNFDGSYRNQIDISAQPSGVYFLIIAQQDKQFTRKIVKQ